MKDLETFENNMTPERKRIVVAEFRGWTSCKMIYDDPMGRPPGTTDMYCHLPDYGNDHDAISEVYDALSDEQMIEYLYHLTNIIRTTDPNVTDSTLMLAAIGATREQRMDALVKTIGKWEE